VSIIIKRLLPFLYICISSVSYGHSVAEPVEAVEGPFFEVAAELVEVAAELVEVAAELVEVLNSGNFSNSPLINASFFALLHP